MTLPTPAECPIGNCPLRFEYKLKEMQDHIDTRLDEIMAQVKVNQEDLDALDQALDAAAQSISDKLAALDIPAGDLQALQSDVENLRGLGATVTPAEPPAEEPPAEEPPAEPTGP